jgi:hypothetical protein
MAVTRATHAVVVLATLLFVWYNQRWMMSREGFY